MHQSNVTPLSRICHVYRARHSLCSPPCHHISLNNLALIQRNAWITCRGRGNIYCRWILVLPPQLRGEVAASQSPARKFKVEAHTVLLFPAGTVVSSSCAAVLEGWVHCKCIQQCYRQKSTPFNLLWGERQMTWLGVEPITHPADRPVGSSSTAAHQTDALCVCLRRDLVASAYQHSTTL